MSLDNLAIVIDIIDSFSDEIDELLLDLQAVGAAVDVVDGANIDLDTGQAHSSLTGLMGQIEALRLQLESMDGFNLDAGSRGGVAGAAAAAGGVVSEADKAADSFDITNLRMSDLHNALAKLVPLIFVYIGALPAAIGGVIALGAAAISAAAGLAALAGLGAMGFVMTQEMSMGELFNRIKEDFIDAFGPLARELAPLFSDALDGLESLFDEIADRGNVLLALRDDAEAFGGFMLEWVPNVLAAMGKMADAFGPLFGNIASSMQEMDMLRGLTEFMAEAAPAFMSFISSAWSLIKTIARLSIGFLQVASAVTRVIDIFLTVITLNGLLSKQIGAGIAALLSLATAFFLVSGIMKLSLVPAIMSAIGTLKGYIISAYNAVAAEGILGAATGALSSVMWSLATAVAVATGGLALIAGLGAIVSSQFDAAGSSISDATDALKNFDNVRSNMDGGFGGGGSAFYQFNPDSSRTIINAPDAETGKRVAAKNEWSKGQTDDYIVNGG